MEPERQNIVRDANEHDPLLENGAKPTKKRFYRARPLWVVPFAIVAAISRGMTIAPRIEVFTQLACNTVHGHPIDYNHTNTLISITSDRDFSGNHTQFLIAPEDNSGSDDGDSSDPTQAPSKRCLSDSKVQSGAARLQTIMMTTMGALSAITTGWWGRYGERHGRILVLAAATVGLMLTDLFFILVSMPGSPFSGHGHKLLIVAPIIEGLLGGWPTLQAATSAYVSDCTSSGSRARIFSRFSGIFFLGFATGPILGAFIITHPPPLPFLPSSAYHAGSVTPVFWIAVLCQLANFCVAMFVLPESLGKAKRKLQELTERDGVTSGISTTSGKIEKLDGGFLHGILAPLLVFAPKRKVLPGNRVRRDWNMTLIALALFGYLLSAGLYQLKYLYAEHVFGWNAQQLSYYITAIGGARALYLLFVMPFIVALFKPTFSQALDTSSTTTTTTTAKPKPTKAQLAAEMRFDLRLSYLCYIVDLLSHTLVSFSSTEPTVGASLAFAGFTLFSSVGSGVIPALQSLALCILQTEAEEESEASAANRVNGGAGTAFERTTADTGSLFGAFSVLQATGQMIIGPMLFGLVYSSTVATFPKGIFVLAASFVFVAVVLLAFVRTPQVPDKGLSKKRKGRRWEEREVERGRSRISKDLSRGVVAALSVASTSMMPPPPVGSAGDN